MKTTIEVPDSLFEEIKRCAKTRGIPLREVIEDALRAVVRTQTGPAAFHLRNGSYGKPGAGKARSWAQMRETIYTHRGE